MRFDLLLPLILYYATHGKSSVLRRASTPATSISGFDLTDQGGVRAAQYAAPVWLFGREEINGNEPCYPEGATDLNGGPNPGTAGPVGPNPGEDCRDPLPANGKFSPGGMFQNYITVLKCGDTWRINYSIYYVHDGAGSEGHRHDWESATVVLRQDPGGKDMWHRDSLVLSFHDTWHSKSWKDIQTVNMDGDLRDTTVGKLKMHPKVYVGFFKHAGFFEAKTDVEVYSAGSKGDEYRSDDWFFMGDMNKNNFVQATKLDKFHDDYEGKFAPYYFRHKKDEDAETLCTLPLP